MTTHSDFLIGRIALEALTNVVRHAGASSIAVGLQVSEDRAVICVNDNGRGFTPQDGFAAQGHYGLVGMKERTQKIGGELSVTSGIGKGTAVTVTVPLR